MRVFGVFVWALCVALVLASVVDGAFTKTSKAPKEKEVSKKNTRPLKEKDNVTQRDRDERDDDRRVSKKAPAAVESKRQEREVVREEVRAKAKGGAKGERFVEQKAQGKVVEEQATKKSGKAAAGVAKPPPHKLTYQDKLLQEMRQQDESHGFKTDPTHPSLHAHAHVHPGMDAVRQTLAFVHSQQSEKDVKIPKKVFSSKVRLLFVAGLEGTGHHAVKSVLSECYERNLCARVANATYDLFRHSTTDGSHGLFGVKDAKYSSFLLERFYRHLHELKQRSEETQEEHLYVFGMERDPGSGMLSYPTFNDRESKVFDHLDLVPMALIAEAVGIDFRVIVLQRNAHDIFVSTMIHRHFGNGIQPHVLLENAAALYSQLSFLSPEYFLCLRYHEMTSYGQSTLDKIAAFLHPQIDAPLMKRMWSQLRPANASSSSSSSSSHASPSSHAPHAAGAASSHVHSAAAVAELMKKRQSGQGSSHRRLRRGLAATEPPAAPTASAATAAGAPTVPGVVETAQIHDSLRAYEFFILRLAMEIKRVDHLCPALQ
eukprot:gene14127-10089_t